MKPGLAVLPLEVWTDVFVYPWISRQQLAQIVDQFKNRKFAEKLQFRLHDWGKQTLRFFEISSKLNKNLYKYQMRKLKKNSRKCHSRKWKIGKIHERQASLAVVRLAHRNNYKKCEFPEIAMPENIHKFKKLTIRYVDDQVLEFLNKVKPLLINVYLFLNINSVKSAKNLRIFLGHLFPMIAGIRGIKCDNDCLALLDWHFPRSLALSRELDLSFAEEAFIPIYLDWLCAPLDFEVDGPRFLKMDAESDAINAIIEAVRTQFLAATKPSAFVVFLQFYYHEWYLHAEEFTIENTATNEQLVIRNACYDGSTDIYYLAILRHPKGADARMREWVEQRAYFDRYYTCDDEGRMIWIAPLKIGQITKEAESVDEDGNESSSEGKAAGPSTSAQK